jgi:hypothetical protein
MGPRDQQSGREAAVTGFANEHIAVGKAFYMAGQGDLLVTGIFTKHGVLLDWGLAVLLRF